MSKFTRFAKDFIARVAVVLAAVAAGVVVLAGFLLWPAILVGLAILIWSHV